MHIEIRRWYRTFLVEKVLHLDLVQHIRQNQNININGRWLAGQETPINVQYHIRRNGLEFRKRWNRILQGLI